MYDYFVIVQNSLTNFNYFNYLNADYNYYFCGDFNLLLMTIIIEVVNFDNKAQEKVLYRNSIILHDDLTVDFDCLYKSLKTLYPKSSFINFKISTK